MRLDDEFGEPLPDNSHSIAKEIAEANGFGHLWESYHSVVKQTIEWLAEHNYLAIIDAELVQVIPDDPKETP